MAVGRLALFALEVIRTAKYPRFEHKVFCRRCDPVDVR